ncbi:MAG: hypothetical protein WA152_01835 [Microgenomates group bacterium]
MKKQTVTVWGTRHEIEPLIDGLDGVWVSAVGTDSIDAGQPVVEIKFNPLAVSIDNIFRAVSRPQENELGGIANGVNKRMRI